MKMYFATWLEDGQGVALTKAKGRNRLLSYWFISQSAKFDIVQYQKTGLIEAKNEKRKIRKKQTF